MTTKRIQGVVFDLDGTLYSLRGQRLRMALKLWSDVAILRHVSGSRSWLRSRSFDTKKELKGALFEELGRRAGIDAKRAESWYHDRFFKGFLEMLSGPATLRPGLLELLSLLRDRGVRLAVFSDYDRVGERLDALGIGPGTFDDVCSAEDFGALKPSPRALMAICERWGMGPGGILVVGDRSDLDGKSAEAAGMEFLGVGNRRVDGQSRAAFLNWQEAVKLLDARTGCEAQPKS